MDKNEKNFINEANMLALQFFTVYNRMLQLAGNSEEALKLTHSLFAAIFKGSQSQQNPEDGGFTIYWDK